MNRIHYPSKAASRRRKGAMALNGRFFVKRNQKSTLRHLKFT